jgi:hypothetical protein
MTPTVSFPVGSGGADDQEVQSNIGRIRVDPWRAIRTSEPAGGFGVAGNGSCLRVVGEGTTEFRREVGEDAAGAGDVSLLDVGSR